MGPRYARYFRDRLETLAFRRYAADSPFAEDAYRAIRRALDDADLLSPLVIRPDAELFLVLNFYELVVLPSTGVEPDEAPSLVFDAIPGDVRLIVESAAQRAASLGDVEISGHDVLQAISANWER